ncbi:Spy/CpxP family protein refolding chaperone [Dechloromonas sp. XY25]|uniref:Spy/CpxP family protein refolding chaperone n=1 Tax=Dechloromonas hankyongensis TaxID=2908002 RepID=A0ABS9K2V1_9RHOO|nr:Spy/CpxP family protein refolding chaperone [Dechloromonas hankyongensis]MCG2577461.1 Spy/CpxP family protein refolding chaperone [Dechloromonas hankyongensis]
MKHGILSLVFVPLLLAACASGPDARGGPGGGRGGDMDGPAAGMGGRGADTVVAQTHNHLQLTAEALKLTPGQTVLWDAYVEKISALMADQMKLQAYHRKQTAMQQIAETVDTVRNRLTAMEEIQETASKLYGALDESQQKTADQTLPGTVPALYSALGGAGGGERSNPCREGPGGGGMKGPSGGMGGGFGRM